MFKLPVRTWVRNAAAVFSGQYGSVTGQAQNSQCSREGRRTWFATPSNLLSYGRTDSAVCLATNKQHG